MLSERALHLSEAISATDERSHCEFWNLVPVLTQAFALESQSLEDIVQMFQRLRLQQRSSNSS